MKIKNLTVLTAGSICVMLLVSCESHEQRADAFDKVKEEKLASKESNIISKEIVSGPAKPETVKSAELSDKKEIPDEWAIFKTETEKKILLNETKIKEIKGIPNMNARLLKQVAGLEQENNNLRKQMDEYSEEVRTKWENFKATMNHDVNEIGIKLKDINMNNRK